MKREHVLIASGAEEHSLLLSEPPAAIDEAGIVGRGLDYEWETAVSRAIRAPLEDEHPELTAALEALPARALLTLMAACLEWVSWRMSGTIPVDDALARCRAIYVAAHDPALVSMGRPTEPFPTELTDFHGPLKLARMLAADVLKDLQATPDDLAISGWVLSSVLLARHVVSGAATVFGSWLQRALERCQRLGGPRDAPFQEQAVIARACLFEPADDWTPASVAAAAAQELDSVAVVVNGYLQPSSAS